MPRALLVNPWIHDLAAQDRFAFPLGLLSVGSALRQAGYQLDLCDLLRLPGLPAGTQFIPKPAAYARVRRRYRRLGVRPEAARAWLSSRPRPDLVLVTTVMTYWYPGVVEAVGLVKEVFPGAPVALGGVYATLMPDHARAVTGADFIAVGDGLAALPHFLDSLGLPSALPQVPPPPAWELYGSLPTAAVLFGRGCFRDCPYCASRLLNPGFSRRGPGDAADEIERLVCSHAASDLAFYDDALLAGGDGWLLALLEELDRREVRVRFHAINAMHLKGFTPSLAQAMRRAGFRTVRFGLETADPARGEKLGDKAALDDLARAAEDLWAAGYAPGEIGVYLLVGLPGQRPAEVEAGIRAALAAGARPYLTEYSPVPGTALWPEAVAAAPFDLAAEPLYHNNTIISAAHPDFTPAELQRLKNLTRAPFQG